MVLTAVIIAECEPKGLLHCLYLPKGLLCHDYYHEGTVSKIVMYGVICSVIESIKFGGT